VRFIIVIFCASYLSFLFLASIDSAIVIGKKKNAYFLEHKHRHSVLLRSRDTEMKNLIPDFTR
jgi:hypothetical protein